MVSYLADRAAGMAPLDAARRASEMVADILEDEADGQTRRSVKEQEGDEDEADDHDRDQRRSARRRRSAL